MPQSPWMSPAWADLGLHEIPGAATNARIADYFRLAGHAQITSDETAWCAAFVGACLETSGITSSRSLRARSYLDWGVPAATPTLGAITVLSRGDDLTLGHVGFLVGETEQHVVLLGGNQSDAVTVARFDRRGVLGFRLPAAANIPIVPPVAAPSDPPGFTSALAMILEFEGGWTDDPFDPGGPTNRGITLATFARERGVEVTAENVGDLKSALRRISETEVRNIYLERYWTRACCSDMPAALALIHFDASVNQGVTGAARMLQDALDVTVDGEIGPVTLAAANNCDLSETISRYADIRRAHYRSLQHFWRFGRGWLRRVEAIATAARARASAIKSADPSLPTTQPGKPPMSSTQHPSSTVSSETQPSTFPGKW